MNADELLLHYEKVADSPDAVGRIRRFVLELAVRGKLVPQDASDEPAQHLLARMATERARHVAAGQLRVGKAQEIDAPDHPFKLPESWAWVALGNVFVYDAGAKCEPSTLDPKVWLLELEDIEKDTGRLLARRRVSDRASQSTKSEFRAGDVLYGKLRPYLNKVLVADEPGYSTTEIVALRPYISLCPGYCVLALRRPDFVEYVTRLGQGTKMPRLRTDDAVTAPFPMPPLAEQHRIVAKLNELMALCDRLELARAEREAARDRLTTASLARLSTPDPETFHGDVGFALDALPILTARHDQVNNLRKALLGLAVRGLLVPQLPGDKPSPLCITPQSNAAATKVRRGVPNTVEVPAAVSAWILPSIWERCSAASMLARGILLDLKDGNHGANHPKVSEFTESGTPFITAAQVANGEIDFKGAYKLSGAALARLRVGFAKKGDVIYTHKGSVGRVAIATADCVLSPQTTYYRPNPKILDSSYLMWFLASDLLSEQVDLVKQQTTRDFVAISKQYCLFHVIPPLAEQIRIAAKVSEVMALCDQLENGLVNRDSRRSYLFEALLHEAIEPAAMLEEVA